MKTIPNTGTYKGHKSLADMIFGHLGNWREALIRQKEIADNEDDKAYIDHELNALDHIETACKGDLDESKRS